MRHKIVAYFTGLIAICAGSAGHAFTEDERLQEVQLGEYCTITGAVDLSNQAANVLINDGAAFYYAGGFAFFFGGELWATQDEITEATIASCLGGIGAEDVELVVNGANGPNFASDDLIGFGFKLAQDANDFTANTFYSYTVGTGTLTEPDDFVLGPSVSLNTTATSPHSGPFTVAATFSESVSGFESGDITVGNGTVSNFAGANASYTFVVTPDADGTVTVDVAAGVATGAANSDDNTAATQLSITADGTSPSGYSVSFDQASVTGANDDAVSFTFAGAEVGATYDYTISSSGGGTNVSSTGTITALGNQITGIDVSGLGDGTLTLSVTLTDPAGNEGAATEDTASKDATAPTGHSVAFTQSGVSASNESAIGFTISNAEDVDYSYTISSNGGGTNVTGSGTISGGSETVTGLDLSGLEDGTLTLSVVLTDAAGNAATAVEDSVSKDGLAPDAPSAPTLTDGSNSGSTTDTLTNDTTPTINGTAEANATVTVYLGATETGTATADSDGDWSFTFAEADLTTGENSVTVTATDAAGNTSAASAALVITLDADAPTVTITGPTDVVTTDFTVTLTFSEVVTGFAAEDITVTNGEKGTFTETTPGKVYTLVVTPELGTTVAVSIPADKAQDAAGNGNEASDVFEVSAGSPASEFEKDKAEIKQDIVTEVQNTLQNAVTANVRMVKEAKSRFIASTRSSLNGTAGFAGQNNVPFDVDGVANGTAMRLSTNGTFFGQAGNDEGTKRRVFFGDFSIVGEKGGSVTGSISGKVAWEQNLSDKTMYGYFIGAQVNQTDIKTTFTGKQQGYGVNIGSYVVNEVAENVYIDGFVSLGMGKSDLDMSNDVLSLDGTYDTKSATIGGALTGVYDMESYEFWPELAFTAGKTQVGTAKFTGRAYGLVDNNLSLDAGDVTVANLTLRPEVRIPLEAGNQSGATSQVTFAPRAICERITTDVTTENCGRGAELGFLRRSGDGLTQITGRLSRDYVGTSTRTGLELKLEHRF